MFGSLMVSRESGLHPVTFVLRTNFTLLKLVTRSFRTMRLSVFILKSSELSDHETDADEGVDGIWVVNYLV